MISRIHRRSPGSRILRKAIAVSLCAAVIGGCGSTAPAVAVKTSQELASERLSGSLQDIREGGLQGDSARVGRGVESALEEPAGPAQVAQLFSSVPNSRRLFLAYLEQGSLRDKLQSIEQARSLKYTIERSRNGGLLTAVEAEGLLTRLTSAVASGAIKVSLLDAGQFPLLDTPERRPQLADQSIAAYKAFEGRRDQMLALLAYVKAVGPASAEGTRVSTALLRAGIRRDELPDIERELPLLAARAKEDLFGNAASQNPNDVLVARGRVTARSDIAAQHNRSTGIIPPGMGGAIGGAVAGLLSNFSGTPAYSQYTIRENNGSDDYIDSFADLKIGECVEAYVDKARADEPRWKRSEVRFVPSKSCEP
jgi:hypothetical protein